MPAALGLGLTLYLMAGRGGLAELAAIGATVTTQGGLLVGEFATSPARPRLSYRVRFRRGLKIAIPFGATAGVALLILIYVGLGYRTTPIPSDFWFGPAIVLLLMLGGSILLTPVLVLDADPSAAFLRAMRSGWRPVAAMILGAAYVAALTGAVWLGPDQLLSSAVVSEAQIALVRAVAGWAAVAALSLPFWWLVTQLYVAPATG